MCNVRGMTCNPSFPHFFLVFSDTCFDRIIAIAVCRVGQGCYGSEEWFSEEFFIAAVITFLSVVIV
jgi:hypothetical protein